MVTDVHAHTEGDRRYTLTSAILLYSTDSMVGNDVYATVHGIRRDKGGAALGVGVPATIEACGDFARAIADRAAFSGFLSPNLLYVGPRTAAWWRPPQPTRVWFKTEDAKDPKRDIGERTAVTPHPGLVFVVSEGRWFVFAVKGDKRPGPETRTFRAPYFNVWVSGQICEGNVQRPSRVTPETIDRFEQAFFESRFTHSNVQRHSDVTRYKGGFYALWRALLDGKFKRAFPEETLVPHSKATLAEQLRNLEEKK